MQGPRGGLPAPDSYAGSAAPSIAGVCGQPPPIFTRQGVAAATSTTPMFVNPPRRPVFVRAWRGVRGGAWCFSSGGLAPQFSFDAGPARQLAGLPF